MSSKPLVISHAQCFDGQASIWVAEQKFGPEGAEYRTFAHGQALPDELGAEREVYLIDFTFPELELRELAKRAAFLTIIDHHKSAAPLYQGLLREFGGKVRVIYSTELCGSRLAWEWWFATEPVPELLLRIDDYDRWQFKYDDTRFVIAALQSYPFDRATWRKVFAKAEETGLTPLAGVGIFIRGFIDLRVAEIVSNAQLFEILGYTVPLVNAPRFLAGEAANVLASFKDNPFAMAVELVDEAIMVSLRSVPPHGVDVSKIAAKFGGGGHKHAAGFRFPFLLDGIHEIEADDEPPHVADKRPGRVLH